MLVSSASVTIVLPSDNGKSAVNNRWLPKHPLKGVEPHFCVLVPDVLSGTAFLECTPLVLCIYCEDGFSLLVYAK